MLKIITWLPIALLFILQASAQHPVVQRVIQKDPQLLIERQQNENSYIVAIATDPNTRTSYLISRYGFVADSVAVSPADLQLIAQKKVSAFTHYQAVTGKMTQIVSTARQQLRNTGSLDKKWPYATLLSNMVPGLDTTKSHLQKLLLLDRFAQEFHIASFLATYQKKQKRDMFPDSLSGTPGSFKYMGDSTVYINSSLLAEHRKAVMYENKGRIIFFNILNEPLDTINVSSPVRTRLRKERTDVFLLYRGWLETQKIEVDERKKLLAEVLQKPVLQLAANRNAKQAALNVLAESMHEAEEIEKKLNNISRPANSNMSGLLEQQTATVPENQFLLESLGMGYTTQFSRGTKKYELTDHRGNVMAVVTDRKLPVDDAAYNLQCYPCFPGTPCPPCEYVLATPTPDGITDYYTADVAQVTDYFPFGMNMPGRKYNYGITYRYGVSSKEADNEIKGEGNSIDFGDRMYDPRIARWLSPDPLKQIYTSLSPYVYSANDPINIIDADGNILKDKQGNIIATADARVDDNNNKRVINYPDGSTLKISYKYVTIYTDEGNPVTAKIVTKAVVRTKAKDGKMIEKPAANYKKIDVNANCHGYAFAEGKVIIDDGESMKKILEDDAYKYLGRDNSKEADLLVIYDKSATTTDDELKQGKIEPDVWHHSAKREKGKNTFTDKDDEQAVRTNLSPQKVEEYDNDKDDQVVLYYRKEKNKGGKKVDVTTGTVKNGVRTVDKKEIERIKQKEKATSSN